MRLAQLARKIGIKPSEIAAFLANKNLPIEDTSNAKVADELVEVVLMHYAPNLLPSAQEEEAVEEPAEKVKPTSAPQSKEIQEEVALDVPDKTEEVIIEESNTSNVVIKPVLVELPGLKVVGKIDLPEPKKKEEEHSEEGKEVVGEEKLPRKESHERLRRKRNVNQENERRPRKNIVALQREREAREALKRKLHEKEREKELKTQRYLKKVKSVAPPPQRIKKKKLEDEYEVYSPEIEKPRSFIVRILNWFVSE